MKLGLILKITNGGESETFSINKQEAWARYASDARSAIKELRGFDGSDKTVYLLKFLGGIGYLLSVIKSRPEGSGRPNDNTAAWIFVPSSSVVPASEMEQVLKQVEEAISESKGVNNAKLEETFNKDYETKKVLVSAVGSISSSADGNYALRYYNGDYRLNELLGEHLAQAEYVRFKGVFFVENNSGVELSTNDVLNFEPKQSITISPLKSVGGFVAGFPTAKGFVKFDRDIELAMGQKITMEWHRDNYAPIVKTFTAGVNNTANLEIKEAERLVRIQRSWFKVQDFHGVSIKNANVSINHQLITGDYLDVAECLLVNNGIYVDIQASGYEEFHEKLQEIPANKVIKLHHRVYETEYVIPIYDGEQQVGNAKLTVSAKQRISKSPLKGYEIESHNVLVYRVGLMSKFKTFAYGFVSCFLLILLYAGAQALEEYEFQFRWPPFKHVECQQPPTSGNETDGGEIGVNVSDSLISKAVNYLDSHKSWNKDSLENNEITQGLFDELNEFKVDDLNGRFEEKLHSSQNLQKVVEALSENQNKGFNPHDGKLSNGGNYNKSSDKNINIDNYIKYLSVNHAPKSMADDFGTIPNSLKQSKTTRIVDNGKKTEPAKKATAKENKIKPDASKDSKNKTKATMGTRGEAK